MRRFDDLGAAAVVQGDVEEHAGVAGGLALGRLQLVADVAGQLLFAADDAKADVVAQQRVQLEAQIALEQRHQRRDFRRRTLPVLDRERVERQDLDAETGRRFDDVADRIDPGAVAFDTRQMALRGPAAVAVHDDGDVPRQTVEVDLAGERLFR